MNFENYAVFGREDVSSFPHFLEIKGRRGLFGFEQLFTFFAESFEKLRAPREDWLRGARARRNDVAGRTHTALRRGSRERNRAGVTVGCPTHTVASRECGGPNPRTTSCTSRSVALAPLRVSWSLNALDG